jgi:tetratricopeptide (TPR) repeat protein
MESGNAPGIERLCAYLKTSKNKVWQRGYYEMLGLAYAGVVKFDSGSADPTLGKAIDNLSKALAIPGERASRDADFYDLRGSLYLQNKRPGEAIGPDARKALEDFSQAIALKPNTAAYYLHRGYAHNQLLDINAAWADFQKAKVLDASNAEIDAAYQKQKRFFEQQAETRKKLDEIGNSAPAR